jgi:hypothetical protein
MLELCLESLNSPACYLSPTSMLSAFSCGRPTALVLEMGTNSTRIRPVVDGYGLHKAYLETRKGGAYLDGILQQRLEGGHEGEPSQNIVPGYEVQATRRNMSVGSLGITHSYRQMHVRDVVTDLKKWTCFIPYKPLPTENRPAIIGSLNIPPFELPDGTLVKPRDNLCTLPEEMWFTVTPSPPASGAGQSERKRSRGNCIFLLFIDN